MRFRIVLFDLDGTLIDSGPIILASMQHAVRTVLDRDIGYAVSRRPWAVRASSRRWSSSARVASTRLVEVYREHNDPLHETLEAFDRMIDVLPKLRAEGRRLGIVTAKRHRTVAPPSLASPGLPSSSRWCVGHDDTDRHKRSRPVLAAVGKMGAEPADAAYVGDSPFDIQAAKAAGAFAVAVSWGGIHSDETLPTRSRMPSSTRRKSCSMSSRTKSTATAKRRGGSGGSSSTTSTATTSRRAELSDAAYDALYDELQAVEDEHQRLVTADSPTQRVNTPPAEGFRKVEHRSPMGSLEKVTTAEALTKWANDIFCGASARTKPWRTCSSRRSTAPPSRSSTRAAPTCAERRAGTRPRRT